MDDNNDEILLILSTTDTRENAELIADTLIFERLAACVQIGGEIRSSYIWNGKAETTTEYPISIKAPVRNLEALRERFKSIHPYECPQWICLKAKASGEYAKWVSETQPLKSSEK